MAKLIVSFEIAWDDDKTYRELHKKLNEAITEGLSLDDYWCETTSFYVIDTDELPSKFAARVWNGTKLRKSKDKLLVVDAAHKAGAAVGEFEDQTLFDLFPFVKKLAWT